MTLHCYTK